MKGSPVNEIKKYVSFPSRETLHPSNTPPKFGPPNELEKRSLNKPVTNKIDINHSPIIA